MKSRIVLFSLLITAMMLEGFKCSRKPSLQEANKAEAEYKHTVAANMLKEVQSKATKEQKKEIAFRVGENFRIANRYKEAQNAYEKAMRINDDPTVLFRLAQMKKMQEYYADAIIDFQNYLKKAPTDSNAIKELRGCELALKWKNDTTRYVVENFKIANTKSSDYCASWGDKKHQTLYFTSDREEGASKKVYGWTGFMHTDIWETHQEGKKNKMKWQKPTLLEALNTKYNDGTTSMDSKYSTMYFTQCNGKDGKDKTCKIYVTSKRGKEWEEPIALPFNSDTYNCGNPSISADGSQLFFSSDMPGGFGANDIYVVNFVKRGKTWSDPINLGPTINTELDEMFPYIHTDGTLFFSSEGHIGMGGLDIFSTTGNGQEWTTPVNMKYPINSGGDDFGIIMEDDKESGFFSSDRKDGRGFDDIYQFHMTPLVFTLSGVVRNSKTNAVIPGALVLISNDQDTSKMRIITDASGYYKVPLKANTTYEMFASKVEDYYKDSRLESQTTVGRKFSADLVQDFELDPMNEQIFVIPIFYGLDSANIYTRKESVRVLTDLVDLLKRYPKVTIELGSHTDCRADSLYNERLSQRRADSAVAFLVNNGIEADRVVAKGYGESDLAVKKCNCEGPQERIQAKACTEEEHQLNRRTTVKVTSISYKTKVIEAPKTDTPPGGKEKRKPQKE